MLDGMQLRPSTYMGGTSSWAQPCSWTQRQLSIKERHPAFTVCTGWGGSGECLSPQKQKGPKKEQPKTRMAAHIKGKYFFY